MIPLIKIGLFFLLSFFLNFFLSSLYLGINLNIYKSWNQKNQGIHLYHSLEILFFIQIFFWFIWICILYFITLKKKYIILSVNEFIDLIMIFLIILFSLIPCFKWLKYYMLYIIRFFFYKTYPNSKYIFFILLYFIIIIYFFSFFFKYIYIYIYILIYMYILFKK